jgi:hypothetical protein
MRPANALTRTGFVTLAIALTIAACVRATPAGAATLDLTLTHVFATRGCTQEDAPALEIYLTQSPFAGAGEPAPPYIRIEVSSPVDETIRSVSLELIQMRRDPAKPGRIARAELVEPGKDRVWLSGTLTLNEAAPGQQASGQYAFRTPAGLALNRSFKTDYSKRNVVCG